MTDNNWAIERRMDYIDWLISTRGELQRADICALFGVSEGQASIDINQFMAAYPDAIRYDKSAKRFVSSSPRYRRRRSGAWTQAIDWSAAE